MIAQPINKSPINKSMDRDDLLTPEGVRFTAELNQLAEELDQKRLSITSWYGGLTRPPFELSRSGIKKFIRRRLLGHTQRIGPTAKINRGGDAYESLPGVSCDDWHPWFLYWEAYWVMTHGPELSVHSRVLDAGGTASLFSYFLASRGSEIHSIDLNKNLIDAGKATAHAMNWNLSSYYMDMADLKFDDNYFDHVYSICVFEHMKAEVRQRALREIARVLKPGGMLCLTFDYGAPGVNLSGIGMSYDPKDRIQTVDDVHRHFFSCDAFEPVGNAEFFDNGKKYLVWRPDPSKQYSFGSVFLRKS